jgi:hypothetical protein
MVNRQRLSVCIFVLLAALTLTIAANTAVAQSRTYHFGQEWVQIWINQDGTIDLSYHMSLTLDSGPNINFIQIGQPNGDFEIGEAVDQYGRALAAFDDSSGSDYKVRVPFAEPLTAGQTIEFNLTTNVARMIYEDAQNPGNVGMQFTPTWWEQAVVEDLRILIIMPEGVTEDAVKTTEVFWNSTQNVDGRLGVYWEKQNLAPNERYPVGVSFPSEYVQNYEKPPTGVVGFLQTYGPILFIGGIAVVVVGFVVVASRKKAYLSPKVSMESLGIKRGLTAVEASYLLDLKPTQMVTEILYSLLQKRAVWAESTNPSLKLRIMPEFKNKTGTDENPLRYYEIDFLNAVKDDGTLDEEKLAHTVMCLRDTVEEKLRGYSRCDTVDYYRKIVTKAWTQVEQAGTVELASKAYDEQLLWLLMDPNNRVRTETAFRNRVFEPNPLWFWYWYGYTHYNPHPTYQPNVNAPAQSAKPPAIPGAEFANNIATAMEKTSSNFVLNLEKFANAIVPSQTPKASHEPAHHKASCVCACHACACACACVSCACACAGGGVG